MCGRFTLAVPSFPELAEILGAAADPALEALYKPRYNIAPTNTHVVLRLHDGHRELVPARWGLINHWSKDPSVGSRQINARSETARSRPAYRDAFERRRCVIPADGFYEWSGPKGARRPLWFHPPKGGLLHLAGLYETWKNPATGAPERTFTVLTTEANDLIAPLHDRMPAILSPEDVDAWIATPDEGEPSNADEAAKLLRPALSAALEARPVSTRVNGTTYDAPDLICEVSAEEVAPAPGARSAAPPADKSEAARGRKRARAPEPEPDMPLFSRVNRG